MSWVYRQIGKLYTPDGEPSAHKWYSGHGEYANVPFDEDKPGLGPIPRGSYTMTAMLRATHMGPVAIHLIPDEDTKARIIAFGRDPMSFYAHDDTAAHDHLASEGCLVCVDGTVGVESLWNSGDRSLLVV